MQSVNQAELLDVCDHHMLASEKVVVPEPYIPYVPPNGWNGILVLAEAQNLSSSKTRPYRESLEALHKAGDRQSLYNRLNGDLPERSGLRGIGVGPWDDGTIKLAVAAIGGVQAVHQTAVSNAILWSTGDSAVSERIASGTKVRSVAFWRDLLSTLRPSQIWTFGATARMVMKRSVVEPGQLLAFPGPFLRRLRTGYAFDIDRLLSAFPEVARALYAIREQGLAIDHEALAVHCACACVSSGKI